MNNKLLYFVLAPIILFGCGTAGKKQVEEIEKPKYEESWESLARHNEEPDWFQDAKFGIYFHWGVYSVPAYGDEWYPRWMHFESRDEYKHHLKKYGHPSEFGYHDFVPMFKAENFNAEEWAELFKKAGARFAGPVAEHHDGFSMWDSDVTPWNAKDKGPLKDITGELEKSVKSRGMKFITTFHHAKNLQRHDSIPSGPRNLPYRNSHYPFFKDMPPSKDDPELSYLYGNIPEDQWFEEVWFGKLKEVIDKYQPDIMWFDSWLDQIPESYRQKYCAYYLNEAQKWNKEVVIVRKQDDLPLDVSVDDLEKSRKNELGEKVWMTDETVSTGSWCYTENLQIKPTKDVLHVLIDIVSKNGVLLLNISPMANGTIPEDQKNVLLTMGDWLAEYGESIYETRPWYTYGEGPTKEPEGHFRNREEFLKIKYSAADIRYTTKGDVIYATLLGWPGNNTDVILSSFSKKEWENSREIKNVSILGSGQQIKYTVDDGGLKITTPDAPVNEMAVVFKIEME
ncbi:MAG TPA: alpha-L-fucosidase [Mariniphaga anaerophila]|uniref:alpha-L-fucosidase n=1 Tax=Mariniphaga anaerophila TaxID=1484053 RepID=A0A831PPH8_9BACT|nr:alpha-L-fucosidase [Mariniphaga anaerophila]